MNRHLSILTREKKYYDIKNILKNIGVSKEEVKKLRFISLNTNNPEEDEKNLTEIENIIEKEQGIFKDFLTIVKTNTMKRFDRRKNKLTDKG